MTISNADGTSNTAMIVEANESLAVVWTKPADYKVDPNRPLAGLGGIYPGGFNVTFADGSVHFISSNVDPKVWKALTTYAGGDDASFDD